MKIAIAQLNYHVGNFDGNQQKMVEAVNQAKEAGADMICFSELATCAYPPRDFLEFDDFIKLSDRVIEKLKELSTDIAIVVGAPTRNPEIEGKDLYNSVFFLYEGKVQAVQHKTLLPTYDIFDEYRYFEPASTYQLAEFKGKRIALTVCEDIWNIGNENPLYTICPLDELIKQDPDFVINVSASPFNFNKSSERIKMLKANIECYGLPMFYINHIGAQTEIIFDGGSIVMSPNGNVFREMDFFKESIEYFDLEEVQKGETISKQETDKIRDIHNALVLGVKDYFDKLGFKKAILGLSGGIDSAVTAALACAALGPENVTGLLMPSEFSSDHSVNDAQILADNLGMISETLAIKDIYSQYLNTLDPLFKGTEFNVTEENLQARIRGALLMAMSNKFGHILLNTTNKSEMAVGYGTLYGDLCGGLSVIGDVYKMDVYALARYINRDKELIPDNSITKPPSAELRPNQKDSDSLPDYKKLDQILVFYIENRKSPAEIISLGYDEELVKRILRLVNLNEFKRYQTAPVLRVSSKAFGMGRRMPIVAKYLT